MNDLTMSKLATNVILSTVSALKIKVITSNKLGHFENIFYACSGHCGASTLSITLFSLTIFSITTLSIMTLSITTLRSNIQHNM